MRSKAAAQKFRAILSATDPIQPVAHSEIQNAFMSKEDTRRAKEFGESELDKRLVALRKKSFDELSAIPDYETEDLKAGQCEVKVTTYRDTLEDGRLQIVVQWYFNIRLGFGHTGANGFTIGKDNATQNVEEKALYEFM